MTKVRNSNLELYRIISMFIIVAHHYVVNSGLMDCVNTNPELTFNNIFLLLLGWGGKTAINGFIFITGYYMCKSNISFKKILKLLLEVWFYNITINLLFMIFGYQDFSIKLLIKAMIPFYYSVSTNFTGCFLFFYLCIPYLNILIANMSKKQHLTLVGLLVFIYTLLPTFLKTNVTFNYVTWFGVLYFIASYLRYYVDMSKMQSSYAFIMMLLCIVVSWLSVLYVYYRNITTGQNTYPYRYVADSNQFLALITALSSFIYFLTLKMNYRPWINRLGASTFGVLCIHANSDLMRQWLWRDVCMNVHFYTLPTLVMHACIVIVGVYGICSLIDLLRIQLLEKPLFKKLNV